MKNKYTYKLLVESEERNKNIMEIALYGLVALSALISIWQFAEQPSAVPLQQVGRTIQQPVDGQFPS
jgi:hypothetical protein